MAVAPWLPLLLLAIANTAPAVPAQQTTLVYNENGTDLFSVDATANGSHLDFGSWPHWCLGDISLCTEGVTVALWVKATGSDPTSERAVVLSNGGHVFFSGGFYVRQHHGNQYEVGVALGTSLWRSDVMVTSDEWFHVTLAWSHGSWLAVYVDGMLEKNVTTPETRRSTPPTYADDFGVLAGLDDVGKPLTSSRFQLQDVRVYDDVTAAEAVIKSLGDNDHLWLGCSFTYNASVGNGSLDVSGHVTPVAECRRHCSAQPLQVIALLENGATCSCSPVLPASFLPGGNCSASQWNAYTVTHVTESHSLALTAWEVRLSPRGYTKPDEETSVNASLNVDVYVVYRFTFDDGVTIVTDKPPVSYRWAAAGDHVVNVSADVGVIRLTASVTVAVEDVDEGVPPTFVSVTGHHDPTRSRFGSFKLRFSEPSVTTCQASYRSNASPYPVNSQAGTLGSFSYSGWYPRPGLFVASANCTNAYGSTIGTCPLLSRDFGTSRSMLAGDKSLTLGLEGADWFLGNLTVLVNETQANFTYNSTTSQVAVPAASLPEGEEALVTVKSEDVVVHRQIVLRDRGLPMPGLTLSSTKGAGNLTLNATCAVPPGHFLHVSLRSGKDEAPETYYIVHASNTTFITSEFTYEELGTYVIKCTVTNFFSSPTVLSNKVTVDIPVLSLQVFTSNVTSYMMPVTLELRVNEGQAVPKHVEFRVDYGDGKPVQVYSVDNTNPLAFDPYFVSYTYHTWGMYNIRVTAANKIGSRAEAVMVQVGEDVTFVDTTISADRVTVNSNVTLTVACPTGSNVTYTVDFGDGTTYALPTSANVTTSLSGEATPGTVTFTHNYTTAGYFGVNVTAANQFSSASTTLCPTVIVDPGTTEPNTCAAPVIRFKDMESSLESPYQLERSEAKAIEVETQLSCRHNNTANYSWRAVELVSDATSTMERTVHQFCLFQETNNTLVVPALSLPYGLYKFSVTVAPIGFDMNTTNLTLYLQIIQSEPVAVLKGGPVQTIMYYETAIFDMSDSHDPDLETDVLTGLEFDVFCTPGANLSRALTLPLETLKEDGLLLYNRTIFRTTTDNMVRFWEYGTCFNETSVLLADMGIFDGRITIGGDNFLTDYISFGFILWVTRNGLMHSTSQSLDVRQNNVSLDDLGSLLELALNADPDTAIRLCDGAANAILNTEATSVDAQEELAASTQAVVSTLGSVAKRVDSPNQASKCAKALKTMTSNKGLVTEDSRTTAASAYMGLSNTTAGMADASIDDASTFAGECLGGFDNIFPTTPDSQPGEERKVKKRKRQAPAVTTTVWYTTTTTTAAPTTTTTTTTTVAPTGDGNETVVTVETTTRVPWISDVTTQLPFTVTTSSIPSTTTEELSSIKDEGHFITYNGIRIPYIKDTEGMTSCEVLEELRMRLPKSQTYDDLVYFICDDCALFRKTMRGDAVQKHCPCVSVADINAMKCEGTDTLQDMIFAIMTYLEHPGDLYDFYLDPLFQAKAIRDEYRRQADASVSKSGSAAMMSVADSVNERAESGDDKERTFQSSRLGLKVQKVGVRNATANATSNSTDGAPEAPKAQTMETNVGAFSMPLDVLSAAGDCPDVNTMFLSDSDNPFTFSKEKSDVGKGVLSLGYSCGGKKVPVSDAGDPVELWMSRDPQQYSPSLFVLLTTVGGTSIDFNYHPVNLTQTNSSLQVVLRPGQGTDSYEVYVRFGEPPNATHYEFRDSVPHEDLSHLGNISDPLEEDELRYSVTVPVELTSRNGTYWVGVKLKSGKLTLADEQANTTYTLMNLVSGCRFWNEENETWSSEGCQVGPKTTKFRTQCLCDHLTSFGADFVVPVNTIDFSTIWSKFNVADNPAVFSTVIVVTILYILILIYARWQDKKDVLKWGAYPLDDNLPTDNYHYQLTVQTGIKRHAGTKSNVSFILSGDDGDTGVRRLDDGKRKELPRSSIMNYVLSVESSLGALAFLRIWHDNSGPGKDRSWYLDQITVTDLQTGEKSIFLCDRWLAVEEDDGMIERILPTAGIQDLIAFKHLFSTSARKKLSNDHLWVSVFSRPTRSNFTRVQRISCCVVLLFMTMITSCMFFKGETKSKKVTGVTIGPITFTLDQLYVSVISTLIVFPVSFLIMTFFRRCKPKKNAILQQNQRYAKKSQRFRWKNVSNASAMWGSRAQKSKFQKFKESVGEIVSSHKQKDKYESELVENPGSRNRAAEEGETKKKKKKPFMFPHWCVYIAWFTTFAAIFLSGFFTILYSMEWGKEKANDWLIAFLMSFFQNVIVIQPIKVILLVAFISIVLKKPDLDEEEVQEDLDTVLKPDEELVVRDEAKVTAVMHRRQQANIDYRPPDPQVLEEARQLRLKEIKMEEVVKEIVVYFLFLLIIFFLSYQQRDSVSFPYSVNIQNKFVGNFDSIEYVPDYWAWMETTFLPALYATKYTNGDDIWFWQDRNCMVDMQARRVGVARIRQLRIKEDSCRVHSMMKDVINHCRSDYNWIDDDTKPYVEKWRPAPPENVTLLEDAETPWVYQSSLKLKNPPYVGSLTTYKGGGYKTLLRRQLCRTQAVLKDLKDNDWLDLRTRAIILDFTLYNPNVNLFASCSFVVEFMSAGGAVTRKEIKILRLLSYVGGWGVVVIFFEVVYALVSIYFFVRCIQKLRKERLKYFKGFWNLLEFVLLCFAVTCIVLYIFKHLLTAAALYTLKDRKSDGFVNFQSIAIYDELYGYVMACVVFMSTIQFLKLLQFNQRMCMLGDTIRYAAKDLKVFSISFLLYFFAFTAAGFLLFSHSMATYNNLISSAESMFSFALGSFDWEGMTNAQEVLGPIFFFLFIGVIYIGMMSIFLTIIGDSFTRVKEDVTLRSNDYEIVDFICNKVKSMLGWK